MDSIKNKIEQLAKALGKDKVPDTYTDYQEVRKDYERQANDDVKRLQQESKLRRIQDIHGRSDLNPKWTFNTLIEDSEDVIEAVSIAQSFILLLSFLDGRKKSVDQRFKLKKLKIITKRLKTRANDANNDIKPY